jgi:hypothetical protein
MSEINSDNGEESEVVKRFLAGKDVWNKWAMETLEKKDNSSIWIRSAEIDFRNTTIEKSVVDFSEYIFPGNTIFATNVFYENVTFKKAIFHGETFFEGAEFMKNANFDEAVFKSTAWFSDPPAKLGHVTSNTDFFCKFRKRSSFNETRFEGEAWFSNVFFDSDIQILNSLFSGWARFDDIKCQSSMQLDGTKFCERTGDSIHGKPGQGGVWFTGARYTGQAWFSDTQFEDDVSFQGAVFDNDAIFQRTIFKKQAIFSGVLSKRVFTLSGANFGIVPIFVQTHFDEAPVFDDVEINDKRAGNKKSITYLARWRALRRLAIQGQDNEKEREYFSGELWSLSPRNIRYWFGVAYWLFSRHGRSVLWPVFWWIILTTLCFFIYIFESPEFLNNPKKTHLLSSFSSHCYNNNGVTSEETSSDMIGFDSLSTTLGREAINLALRNSFIEIGRGSDVEALTYSCLYGVSSVKNSSGHIEYIPKKPYVVLWVVALQRILAALFIFLFGAAVRNILRVK